TGLYIVAKVIDGHTVADGIEEQRRQTRGDKDPPGSIVKQVLQILLYRGILFALNLHYPLFCPGKAEQEKYHADHTDGTDTPHPPHRVGTDRVLCYGCCYC